MTDLSAATPAPEGTYWEWILGHERMPSFDRLLILTFGTRIVGVVRAIAELGIADQLKDGPLHVAELAAASSADELSLFRLMRAAAALGLFAELEDGRFTMTLEAEPLRSDIDRSLRDLVLFSGADWAARPFMALADGVRTGRSAFELVHGKTFYEYAESNPEQGALFDRTMAQRNWLSAMSLLRQVDFSPFSSLADLGGGHGAFLNAVLRRYPSLEGVLFDRAQVIRDAESLLVGQDIADRVRVEAGDLFETVPEGHDVYTLSAVLSGFDDEQANRILRRVRTAMGTDPTRRLFVFEKVLIETRNRFDYSKLLDVDMLVLFGGRERTWREWHTLFDGAGLELLGDAPDSSQSPWAALECRVALPA
ncbi:methyltransferase [Tamaricihabitans halophyticus]|uniref:methyltransferase n=1 Tax=Tamaricihabitans halophyticus TaxID=1262583 RepID=UPI00104F68EA|nr:methyltransferase [Tamaricihabitans halophyticus]